MTFTRIGGQAIPGTLWLRATTTPWRRDVELRLAVVDGARMAIATGLTMDEGQEGQDVAPFLTIDYTMAQALMDELWECGLRPSKGTGSAGAFEAQGRHLEDMRSLVFAKKD